MSRIFLSHSSKDNFAAVAVSDWLKGEGWNDAFLDLDPVEGIAAGERWERALYTQATECEAVIFLVSRSWLGSEWCRREYELARKLNKRVFVALIENIAVGDLPSYLTQTHQAVSLAAGEDHQVFNPRMPITHEVGYVTFSREGLERLRRGLTQVGLDPRFFAWPPESDPGRAPYRGLEPIDAADAGIFFGRDGPIIEVLDTLRGLREAAPPRLFVILGASGAGKSSFLRAGLIPRLSRDDRNFFVLPVIRPERARMSRSEGLVSALGEAVMKAGLSATRVEIRRAVASDPPALRRILSSLVTRPGGDKPPTVVVTIDQAEELFRTDTEPESDKFLTILHDLATSDEPAVIVIFAIRSDSYDALERARPLEGLSQHTFALLPMPRGAYQTIIEGPAKRLQQAGRKFEIDPALTEALLEDIEKGAGSDALPLLSFTLELLYREHEAARRITREDYENFGRLKGAIDAALAQVFLEADADPRIPQDRNARLALLRRGFIPWLAGIDLDSKTPRRRVALASQIPEEARPLIDLLVEHRLLTRDVDKESGEATIEPAHEALLRQWGGLKGWLEEDFGLLATLEGIKRAACDWDANARAVAWAAHGGTRLAEAGRLDTRPDLAALLNVVDRAYLAACHEKDEAAHEAEEARHRTEAALAREKIEKLAEHVRATRRIALICGIGLAITMTLGGIAGWEWKIASARLKAATETANQLVSNLAYKFKNVSGVPASLILAILETVNTLQIRLMADGADSVDLRRVHAAAQEETVDACLAMGKTKCAFDAATEAIAFRSELVKSNPQDSEMRSELSIAYAKMGDVRALQGAITDALNYYLEVRALAESVSRSDPSNATWRQILSFSYEKIGDGRIEQGDFKAAFASYRDSLSLREALSAADPANAELKRDLSVSYLNIGDAQLAQGDLLGALKAYYDSLGLISAVAQIDPLNTRWRQDLATSYEKVGDAQIARDDFAAAEKSYRTSFGLRDALSEADLGNAGWRRDLAVSYNKIGDVLKAGSDFDGALKSYQKAFDIIKVIAASDPENGEWRRNLAASNARIGDLWFARGDYAQALAFYKNGHGIISDLAAADPVNVRWRQDLASYSERIGNSLLNLNETADAVAAFETMTGAYEALLDARPDDVPLRQSLVLQHRRLAHLDKAGVRRHIEAAVKILQDLSTSSRLDSNQRRWVAVMRTQLGVINQFGPGAAASGAIARAGAQRSLN
ncbi:TIR domain-containing protein [Methylocystis sp. IM3]|uniref:nSTAND1 domain-containing NTPase n=2 Tax=Methylocystis TaxID=133 RepID=UPI0030FC2610